MRISDKFSLTTSSSSHHHGRYQNKSSRNLQQQLTGGTSHTNQSSIPTFDDVKRHYTARKMNELHIILQDPTSWKDFQDLLRTRHSHCITNTSIKEDLLSSLIHVARHGHHSVHNHDHDNIIEDDNNNDEDTEDDSNHHDSFS